jgi:hypothetical protein
MCYCAAVRAPRQGYLSRRELSLHVDLAQIVGLMCVRQARQGTRRQRPGFSAGVGAGRKPADAPSPKTSLRRDAVDMLG